MEHVSRSMDFPVRGVHMEIVPNMSNYHESQHFNVSMDQMSFLEPVSYDSEFNTVMMANNNAGHGQSTDGSVESSSIFLSNQPGLDDATMLDSITGPVERKAEMEHTLNSSVSLQTQLPSERSVNLGAGNRPLGSVQPSESQRQPGPVQHSLGSPGSQAQSASSKRKVRPESIGKSGLQRGRPPKKQTAQIDSATKSQPESSDALRSKMRESLAAALALASQKLGNVSTGKKVKTEHTATHQMLVGGQSLESNSTMRGNVPHAANEEVVPSQGSALGSTTSDLQELSCNNLSKTSNFSGAQNLHEFQFNSILPDGDVQFSDNIFVKDDLLQGNGLSWEFHVDAQMEEGKVDQNADKPPSTEVGNEVAILTPENLAFKIEAQLFKLFGGINKKYKEKGRSLLFNLKDQKNPELRERVMSGEISPERLCSMSAEELASKELSEWRIAKAEEFAQMVVLPDTEVNMRRLVKKTHKGEYQVEFEHDDGIADEVSSGSSVNVQRLPKKENGNHSASPSRTDEENVSGQGKTSENLEFSGSLVIPTDGTDLMQGMMVDEFKDAPSLPPIVSLDEFMESLNSEPPFENLSEDAAQKISQAPKVSPKAVRNTQASGSHTALISPEDAPLKIPRAPKVSPKVVRNTQASGSRAALISPGDAPSRRADVGKKYQADMTLKSSGPEKKVLPSSGLEVESIWEGILQLNISSFVAVRGLFQSGEKTSAKEWSTSLEIKGRVRLDAFEKFLQELPKSRTRALMIIQFVLKDKSSESQQSTISEAVDSYTSDERLGFAEPAAGVELYICPPTPRIAELLKKHMPKEEGRESDNSMENGMLGVVVWRRAHISVSPNASSYHKHTSKKQPFFPSNRLQDSSNLNNVNIPKPTRASAPMSKNASRPKPEPEPEEEDDDIPPGFGPVAAARAARDEDDLPEFNFSGGFNSSATRLLPSSQALRSDVNSTSPTVDHVRELIKKYGQSGVATPSRVESRGLSVEPWEDDDDDIPEWRPEALSRLPAHPVARGGSSLLVNRPPSGGLGQPARWPRPHQNMNGARWRQQ
ncbi:uncharacterized protein LOC131024896 [Salvia miltiorrhiza]|uniref:uncharacterized protein LOC131024896 n=1 Tax=Salvia miltiorrhiza TaxID=226208 RepID=UPI0025AC2D66|nr:uncharacterized protein LOC131024896 [Salvia miltiorrhiza]XP_057810427.1 uncharacterized protein LOC131024896 [Salvia miltiorrhiza]